jgi:TolB-like protein
MKTILTIVVLIIAYAITRLVIWNGETAAPPAASGIAVLPFESLSPENENVFLANGVYDGVSTKLAKVADLKVISHNSMAKYRGARNTHEIGRALNVAYVLKGSVRREHREDCHDRIHLNAQLIDTRTDAHVWAQEYDRELCDVWALQGEIAQKVAECVAAKEKIPHTTKSTEGVHIASLRSRAQLSRR